MNVLERVEKVWGWEEWIVNSKDPPYCGKRLIVNRGYRVSYHEHHIKDETFYLYRGKLRMTVNDKVCIMEQGDSLRIKPYTFHSFAGFTDAEIIEFSTFHDDDDTYRKDVSGKAFFRKAYDYDGVITAGIIPEDGAPIITSRTFEEVDCIQDLNGHAIYFCPITYSEKSIEKAIEWKAEMIKRLKIEIYYEDEPEIIVALQSLCLNCHIEKSW